MNGHFSIATTFGTDLSSRVRAVGLRDLVLAAAQQGSVTLDFDGVRTLSDSFADELFGILVQRNGVEWFRANVHLTNLRSDVRSAILEAVHGRLNALAAR